MIKSRNIKIKKNEKKGPISVTIASIVCLYIIFVKAYKICYDFDNGYFDMTILATDLIIQLSCVLILYSFWMKKQINIKYKFICSFVILGAFFVQLFTGLFTFLSSYPRVDQIQSVWLVHVPNLLSLIILVYTLIAYCFRSRP